eukprot:CAMPEP_0113971490 /NCGR_PEP_ID=MMETSP0011_2-20120614/12293_1 /TAXON_ID=101924 /ORGANISM="Rhodosorus marinus" /LENGTH=52 /DNA_ID=CAMNT_0000987047 /DNA_START=57 /DNA_END=215 /DNA_ORIENTATION=- /assembly_acc=CAM_ASM_000156
MTAIQKYGAQKKAEKSPAREKNENHILLSRNPTKKWKDSPVYQTSAGAKIIL